MSVPLPAEARQRRKHSGYGSHEIGGERVLVFPERDVARITGMDYGGVVDENIEAAKAFPDFVKRCLPLRAVADVKMQRHGVGAGRRSDGFRAIVINIGDDNGMAE